MSADDTSTTVENKLVSIDLDELCEVIDSEVESIIKMDSSSVETTPKSAPKDISSIKMEPFSSPASSELSTGARKRANDAENSVEISKKPKLTPCSSGDLLNESEMTQELDIWDEDPKGLYGLSPQFLKAKGIRIPLTNWVHLSNIPCDKSVLREVMELAGNVLICHVVRTKTGYAKVKYSHPIEAAQAVSMLNGQTLVGKTLSVSIDPGPHREEFLPVGLRTLGPGFSKTGKPLRDITRHLQRHLQGKTTPLSNSLFGAEDVKIVEEKKTESNEKATETVVTEPVLKIKKDKISQTEDDGNRKIIETVNEIKKKGVAVYEIIKALKALTSEDKIDTKTESTSSKPALKDNKPSFRRSPSREYQSSRNARKPPSRVSARSVSPRRTPYNPPFGPRTGSSGNFRHNSNNLDNAGPNNDGPRMPIMNNSNFRPGNANFGPGPNNGPFNNFGPQGPNNGPGNVGPFVQQSGPGPNVGPAFGNNFVNSGAFAGNSGPSGPFQNNSGIVGPPSGINQQFGGNFGAIGAPRQNIMGSGVSNEQRSTSNVVVLNNLPPSVTYQLLTEKMNQCGVVQFLNVTKPGTAIVRYACDWEAARCINTFDKTVVDGHQIEVRYS